MRASRNSVLFHAIVCLLPVIGNAQTAARTGIVTPDQQEAIKILAGMDTTKASPYWPQVAPAEFYRNVRDNILYPERIYQGHVTNFCGYSAFTVVYARQQPQAYVRHMLSLYESGQTEAGGKQIKPSGAVRELAGNLQGKGKLTLNGADQLWLMTLPDQFKGYMNLDKKYAPGDENKIWAACTLGKFNKMARTVGGYKVKAYGSDLIRPIGKNNATFIRGEMEKGTVVLYVNSKYLHPAKFRLFVLRAPTHFIVVYEIREVDGLIELKYWDYGLKTVELMTPKRLKKMTFGIIRIEP